MTAGLLTAELVHLFHPPLLAVAIIVRLHAHHRTRARAQLEMLLRQQGVRTRQEQLRSRRWRRRRRGSRACLAAALAVSGVRFAETMVEGGTTASLPRGVDGCWTTA
jgi:hypothetical protein